MSKGTLKKFRFVLTDPKHYKTQPSKNLIICVVCGKPYHEFSDLRASLKRCDDCMPSGLLKTKTGYVPKTPIYKTTWWDDYVNWERAGCPGKTWHYADYEKRMSRANEMRADNDESNQSES